MTWSAGMPAARAASAMLPGAISLGHQEVEDTGRLPAHPFVPRRFVVSQLQHVAQHRDAVAGVQRGQRLQRGFDRGRAGAVRVVQEQAAAAAGERIEPARYALASRPGVPAMVSSVDPVCQPHRDRGQRRVDLMPAQEGDVDLAAAGRGVHREARTFAGDQDVRGIDVGADAVGRVGVILLREVSGEVDMPLSSSGPLRVKTLS